MRLRIPDLAVEVISASTEVRDRGTKFTDFCANQVDEYWIIDPDTMTVEQFLRKGDDYQLHLKSSNGKISSRVIPGFRVSIEEFFDDQANLDACREILSMPFSD